MGKKKWTRILALCLSVVCLAGIAAAAATDLNGDGKTNVWDLQLAMTDESVDAGQVLSGVLGGVNELSPNADGVYEICSVVGMKNLINHAKDGASFKLVADVDMGGMDWTPLVGFKGHFDGGDHTISNFRITKSKSQNMGLFADTENFDDGTQSTISNLHLENVELVADTSARYIGSFVGTNRALITDCTAVCLVTDQRTVLSSSVYIGAIVGRNATNGSGASQTTVGKIAGANELTVDSNLTAQSQQTDTQKVNAKMATNFAQLEEGSSKRNIGIAGFSRGDGMNTGLLLQDITNSTDLVAADVQERRETATDYMYDLCTVAWTPSAEYTPYYSSSKCYELRYYRYDSATAPTAPETRYFANGLWIDGVWHEGGYYRGIPYNHGSSGMDRFLSVMELNDNGIYTTTAALPTEAYYIINKSAVAEINEAYAQGLLGSTTVNGFTVPKTMIKALVSGDYNQVGFNMYIGTDCSSQVSWAWRRVMATTGTGFANIQGTAEMFPTESNLSNYNYWAINGLVFDTITENLDGAGSVNDSGDKAVLLKAAFEADKDAFWNALAQVSKGDLLLHFSKEGGHTRMAIGDAVVIRKWSGEIDTSKSYVVTAEQGASSGGVDESGIVWRSSCYVDRKTTFADLTTNTTYPWYPITCEALRVSGSAAATATCKLASGKITSNFHIVSTTVNGNTVYTGIAQTGHRRPVNSITVASVHTDVKTGDVVSVLLSNGETFTFTY